MEGQFTCRDLILPVGTHAFPCLPAVWYNKGGHIYG
jgi:hypothetical protein